MGQILESFVATSGARKKKFRVDRNCQKLLIHRSGPGHIFNAVLTGLPEILTIENTNTANKRESVADRIQLGYLAGFAQYGEGVIPEIQVEGVSDCYIPVVLGRDGFAVDGNDNFTVLMEELVVGCTYNVYALEVPVTGTRFWEYQQSSILGGDHNKSIDLDAASAILLPSAARINRATVTFATEQGDKTCDYSMLELQFMNAEGNDIETQNVYREDGQPANTAVTNSFGSMTSQLLVLTLSHIKHIQFHTDGTLVDYVTVTERSRLVQ